MLAFRSVPGKSNRSVATTSTSTSRGERGFASQTETPLHKYFKEKVDKYEHKDSLRFVNQQYKWTYKELQKHINGFANGLLDMHIIRGTRIAFALPNSVENVVIPFAGVSLGVQSIPVDPLYTQDFQNLVKVLHRLQPRGLVFSPRHTNLDALTEAIPELPDVVYGWPWKSKQFPFLRYLLQTEIKKLRGTYRLRDVLIYDRVPDPVPRAQVNVVSSDIAYIFPSVIANNVDVIAYDHQSVLKHAFSLSEKIGLTTEDRVLHNLPTHTPVGQSLIWSCIGSGSVCIIPSEGFVAEETVKALLEESPTVYVAEPSSLRSVLDNPKLQTSKSLKLNRVVVVNTNGAAPPNTTEIQEKLGVSKVITINPSDTNFGVPFK